MASIYMNNGDALTAQHIKAMKHCDDVWFEIQLDNEKKPYCQMRLIKRQENSNTGFEDHVFVRCNGQLQNYEYESMDHQFTAHVSMSSYADRYVTLCDLVKTGDELGMSWLMDNNNGYVKEARLHCDELSVQIRRNGQRKYTLLLWVAVGQDNWSRIIAER